MHQKQIKEIRKKKLNLTENTDIVSFIEAVLSVSIGPQETFQTLYSSQGLPHFFLFLIFTVLGNIYSRHTIQCIDLYVDWQEVYESNVHHHRLCYTMNSIKTEAHLSE